MVWGFTQGSSSPFRLGPTLGWMLESFQDSKGAFGIVRFLAGDWRFQPFGIFQLGDALALPLPTVAHGLPGWLTAGAD